LFAIKPILLFTNPTVGLYSFQFINHVLKEYLRPPKWWPLPF